MEGQGKLISQSVAKTASSRPHLIVKDLGINKKTFTANGIETNTMKNKMNRLILSSQRLYIPRMTDIYINTGISLYHSPND